MEETVEIVINLSNSPSSLPFVVDGIEGPNLTRSAIQRAIGAGIWPEWGSLRAQSFKAENHTFIFHYQGRVYYWSNNEVTEYSIIEDA